LWHRQILQQALQVLSTDARDALEESSQCQVHFIAIWLRVWPIWVNAIVFQVPAIHIIESRGGGRRRQWRWWWRNCQGRTNSQRFCIFHV